MHWSMKYYLRKMCPSKGLAKSCRFVKVCITFRCTPDVQQHFKNLAYSYFHKVIKCLFVLSIISGVTR